MPVNGDVLGFGWKTNPDGTLELYEIPTEGTPKIFINGEWHGI